MPLKYEIPKEHYFRLHHIRPRFMFDVENVLIHMATEISNIPQLTKRDFDKRVDEAVKRFPGNETKHPKTIKNWRTEISACFGFIEHIPFSEERKPGRVAIRLADTQDVVEFFKHFLYFFQYPGGYLKPNETVKFIKAGIRFKPAQYILRLLRHGEKVSRQNFGITKSELTHCVFNDLRATRDHRSGKRVYNLIISNRNHNRTYDRRPDTTRYAKEILDYMVCADMLKVRSDKHYYLNPQASTAIQHFIKSKNFFRGYDPLYRKRRIFLADISNVNYKWFSYVNQDIEGVYFKTNVTNYLHSLAVDEEANLPENIKTFLTQVVRERVDTQQIGDLGENLIHGHECQRITNEGRNEIINKIKRIPTQFGIGYDIQSVEADESKRYIEVKTTISRDDIRFNQFHLTTNEWVVAEGLDGRYFVYRLSINKNGMRLFVIQDPVGKYKSGRLRMIPRDGADIAFNEASGEQQEFLIWEG